MTPSQGPHLVLDRSFFPGETALLVPRTDDGRVLFAIPWHDRVLVGHDRHAGRRRWRSSLARCSEEIAYLLDYLGRYLDAPPGRDDVLSTFAGLRPLLRGQAGDADGQALARARRDRRPTRGWSRSPAGSGRPTAGWRSTRSITRCAPGSLAARTLGDRRTQASRLARARAQRRSTRLPSTARMHPRVAALCNERPEWARPLHPSLPYLAGEVSGPRATKRLAASRTCWPPHPCTVSRCASQHRGGRRSRRSARRRARPRRRLASRANGRVQETGGIVPAGNLIAQLNMLHSRSTPSGRSR